MAWRNVCDTLYSKGDIARTKCGCVVQLDGGGAGFGLQRSQLVTVLHKCDLRLCPVKYRGEGGFYLTCFTPISVERDSFAAMAAISFG